MDAGARGAVVAARARPSPHAHDARRRRLKGADVSDGAASFQTPLRRERIAGAVTAHRTEPM
jgi:hypothetical protein